MDEDLVAVQQRGMITQHPGQRRPFPVADPEGRPTVALIVGEPVLGAVGQVAEAITRATSGRSASAHANRFCRGSSETPVL